MIRVGKTYGFCLDKSRHNTTDRHEKDCDSIVVVLIHRPEDQAGDLKDIEWVEDLFKISLALPYRRTEDILHQQGVGKWTSVRCQ